MNTGDIERSMSPFFIIYTIKLKYMGCSIKRVITLKEPIQFKPVAVADAAGNDMTDLCMFAWSQDSLCWVNWVNRHAYEMIASNLESDFYLRILIPGEFCTISVGGIATDCYSACIYSENPFIKDFCSTSALFSPYANLDCALLLQQQLADSVICMFGIDCYYFKVNPEELSVDFTFKEYVLHNVSDVKYVKLMCQDGQLPSSNPKMAEYDFDWDTDWEVEMSKTQFARAFGDTAFPKQRDFVYIPMMKRMYEVNSAYDEKNEGLMWRSTTWKLGLVKWSEKTNVDQGDFENMIDDFIVNTYEETFGREREEQRRQSAADQSYMPESARDSLYYLYVSDAVRKAVTSEEKNNILQKQINNRSMTIARNLYCFKDTDSEILYQNGYCGNSGVISMIVCTAPRTERFTRKTMFSAGDIEVYAENSEKLCVGVKDAQIELDDDSVYILCIRWSRDLFSVELEAYKQTHQDDVPAYLLKPEKYWFDIAGETVVAYDDRFDCREKVPVKCSPAPFSVTNIRLYDCWMDKEGAFTEAMKYTTNSEHCIINDVARPIEGSFGYSVR